MRRENKSPEFKTKLKGPPKKTQLLKTVLVGSPPKQPFPLTNTKTHSNTKFHITHTSIYIHKNTEHLKKNKKRLQKLFLLKKKKNIFINNTNPLTYFIFNLNLILLEKRQNRNIIICVYYLFFRL